MGSSLRRRTWCVRGAYAVRSVDLHTFSEGHFYTFLLEVSANIEVFLEFSDSRIVQESPPVPNVGFKEWPTACFFFECNQLNTNSFEGGAEFHRGRKRSEVEDHTLHHNNSTAPPPVCLSPRSCPTSGQVSESWVVVGWFPHKSRRQVGGGGPVTRPDDFAPSQRRGPRMVETQKRRQRLQGQSPERV